MNPWSLLWLAAVSSAAAQEPISPPAALTREVAALERGLQGDAAAAQRARRRFHVATGTLPGLRVEDVRSAIAETNASPAVRAELGLALVGWAEPAAIALLAERLRRPELTAAEAFALASACAYALGLPHELPSALDLADGAYRVEVAATYDRLGAALAHRSVSRARTGEWVRRARRAQAAGSNPAERHALEAAALALLGHLDPTFGAEVVAIALAGGMPGVQGVVLHALSYASGIPWLEEVRRDAPEATFADALAAAAGHWEARRGLDVDDWERERALRHGHPLPDAPRAERRAALLALLDHASPLVRWSALEALARELDVHPDRCLYFFPENRRHHPLASEAPLTLWEDLRTALRERVDGP